ncbi:hypothetical protein D3C80_1971820 [compost metagenome]
MLAVLLSFQYSFLSQVKWLAIGKDSKIKQSALAVLCAFFLQYKKLITIFAKVLLMDIQFFIDIGKCL